MSQSFTLSGGTWGTATDWSPNGVPGSSTSVSIGATIAMITVDGASDTASYLQATGAAAGGAANTIDITPGGTLNLTGGAEQIITDFTVDVGATGALTAQSVLFTDSAIDIAGNFSDIGGGSAHFVSSSVTLEHGATFSSTQLDLTNSQEEIYGFETLSNGGGGSLNNASITIEAGGTLDTQELNGLATDTLDVQGFLTLTGGGPGVNMSNTIESGGHVKVDGFLDDTTTWNVDGGTFASGNSFQNGTFVFSGTDGVVALYHNNQYNNGVYVSGFDNTDRIFLGTELSTGTVTTSFVNGNTLDVIQGGGVVAQIDGFTMAADASALTPLATVTAGHYEIYLCFFEGTKLATAEGEIAVQDVVAGTMLKTAAGAVLPVHWVGWSQVSTMFADRLRALPVRIKADALAEGVPARDLLVSPDHAIYVEGVLVQAAALVNGTSIFREEKLPESFRYYHVELATHELLLAEGCPAESFVDNVDRMNFHNWDERTAPVTAVVEMDLPRAKSARQVPAAIRAAVATRAAQFAEADAA